MSKMLPFPYRNGTARQSHIAGSDRVIKASNVGVIIRSFEWPLCYATIVGLYVKTHYPDTLPE